MMFKLGERAEQNWRKLLSFKYLAKVIEGVKFVDGEEIERPILSYQPRSTTSDSVRITRSTSLFIKPCNQDRSIRSWPPIAQTFSRVAIPPTLGVIQITDSFVRHLKYRGLQLLNLPLVVV
jgi:hypothetical protein